MSTNESIPLSQVSNNGYTLMNGEKLNAEYPDTFHIPSKDERTTRVPGDLVKLGFEVEAEENGFSGERMWVKIIEAHGGLYIGILNSIPMFIDDLWPEDIVFFQPEHIISIQ